MSSWTKFVTEVYKRNHAKDPNYKFKQAMKDASKEKKSGKMSMSMPSKKMRKSKGRGKKMSGKSRKLRRTGGRLIRNQHGGELPELKPSPYSE